MSCRTTDPNFRWFCTIVEFWLMTKSQTREYEAMALRIAEVRDSACANNGQCTTEYVKGILCEVRKLPGSNGFMEQKALAVSGFGHLYNADGYR